MTSSASNRIDRVNAEIERQNSEFLAADKIVNLEELLDALKKSTLPSNYIFSENVDSVTFLLLSDIECKPTLHASVIIKCNLLLNVVIKGKSLPATSFNYLLEVSNKLSNFTEVLNVLALVKSMCECDHLESSPEKENKISGSTSLEIAADLIDDAVTNCECADHSKLLIFIASQLRLLTKSACGRRYSNELIVLSFIWKMTSTALYKKLSNFFCLPSIRRLQQLSTNNNVHPNDIDLIYMMTRVRNLSDKEKIVNLIIDEVYTSTRIEYQNGEFIGLTENGKVAKTLCVFMVQSLYSKYKDVVKLIQVESLKVTALRQYFDCVMNALHGLGLVVLSVSVDNHVVNRYTNVAYMYTCQY